MAVLEQRIGVIPMAFELVLDRIVEILETELANQIVLATAASQPTEPYEIAVYKEKAIPWEGTQMPLVNVWYDSSQISRKSPSIGRQQGEHVYNIDCLSTVKSTATGTNIDTYGDTETAMKVHAVARVIYQIIMANLNHRLQFDPPVTPAFVGGRMIREMSTMRPPFGDNPANFFLAMRLPLVVKHADSLPEQLGAILEEIGITVSRQDVTKITEIDIELRPEE